MCTTNVSEWDLVMGEMFVFWTGLPIDEDLLLRIVVVNYIFDAAF